MTAPTSATVTLSDNRLAGDSLTTSYATATFADADVGTAKPVTVSGIAVTRHRRWQLHRQHHRQHHRQYHRRLGHRPGQRQQQAL